MISCIEFADNMHNFYHQFDPFYDEECTTQERMIQNLTCRFKFQGYYDRNSVSGIHDHETQ